MGASSTITNEPDGLLAFGIDGPPTSTSDYGRITDGTLSLAGSADPVFDDGFTPSPGSEYVVDTGASTGTFTTVLHGATADYSHPGEVGLTGGAPAAATSTSVTSSAPSGSPFGQGVQLTRHGDPGVGLRPERAPSPSPPTASSLGSSPVTTDGGVTTATWTSRACRSDLSPITATYDGDVRLRRQRLSRP